MADTPSKALPDVAVLRRLGEHMAAGYFEMPDASPLRRWSRAVRRRFENRAPMPYDGGRLYPAGRNGPPPGVVENRLLAPSYSYTWGFDDGATRAAAESATDPAVRQCLEALRAALREEEGRFRYPPAEHSVGGRGYTHSIVNFGRVLREGLDEHERRLARGRREAERAAAGPRLDFYLGLTDVLAGIRVWHANLLAYLRTWSNPDPGARANRDRLVAALERVPCGPARTFFEAMVSYNLVYYLDDCDDPGRLDQELAPFYEHDVQEGLTTRDEAAALVAALAENVKVMGGWSAAIGGTRPDGRPGYNEVTLMLLEAAHGRYRPSLELRVRPDMPDRVWEAALDAVATGSGNPALYNEELYLRSLLEADLGLTPADATWWNGGGCTETMVHGRSNVGSLEAGINLSLILDHSVQTRLATAAGFAEFLDGFQADVATVIRQIADGANANQQDKAERRPQPVRSLLIDDCLERGLDFNAGGARYNWSVVNVAGLSNVIDSLAAIREVVFETRDLAAADLVAALATDFHDREPVRQRLARCPRFGNDDEAVDDLAAAFTEFVFREFRGHRCWRGGRFLPSIIMFATYGWAGAAVGATADGRRAREAVGDSVGPMAGRDRHGPTAMLRSVARLPLHLATGTPVLNLRLAKTFFRDARARADLRSLVEAFFRLGGMQLQISVADRAELEDAVAHPERHGDLIVRIGGYSEYFVRLSADLQGTVIARTEYGPD